MNMNTYKIAVFLFLLFTLFITACDEKLKNPVSEYGDALIDSYKKGQQAGETANLDAVKRAIQSYYATNGKYPESLEAAEEFMGSKIDISKYEYDPSTGRVSLKK